MAMDFPSSPTVGQVYQNYVWTGVAWESGYSPVVPNLQLATYANAAARDAAITAPTAGMEAYLLDVKQVTVYNGSAWKTDMAGLVPIVPTTFRISGGSATANSLGVVTFTGATSIGLDNAFTSSYTNYRVLISASFSTYVNINGRFTVGGAQQTVGYYAGLARAAGNVFDNFSATNTSFFTIGQNASAAARSFNGSLDIFSPQVSGWTGYNTVAMGFDGTYGVTIMGGGHQQSNIQADGIYIYPTTGNISGTIQVLGYNS